MGRCMGQWDNFLWDVNNLYGIFPHETYYLFSSAQLAESVHIQIAQDKRKRRRKKKKKEKEWIT